MLGWNISVYRLIDSEPLREALTHSPDEGTLDFEPAMRERIAVWKTGFDGLDWLEGLVEGRGLTLRGRGFPKAYLLRAGDLVPQIERAWPQESPSRSEGEHDVVLHLWEGTSTIDEAALGSCDPSEWLLVDVVEAS
jgi:hypothetical protein